MQVDVQRRATKFGANVAEEVDKMPGPRVDESSIGVASLVSSSSGGDDAGAP